MCESSSWVGQLLCEILSPTWMAGLLQAFVGTALAALIALLIFRAQLKHDRTLAAEQIEAERRTAVETRKAAAVERCGRALIAMALSIDSMTSPEIGQRLQRLDTRPLRRDDIPGTSEALDAEMEAEHLIKVDDTYADLWREIVHTWRVCATEVQARPALMTEESAGVVGTAFDTALNPTQRRCSEYGRALILWDGHGPMPGREVLGEDWDTPAPQNRSDYAGWRQRVLARFNGLIAKRSDTASSP